MDSRYNVGDPVVIIDSGKSFSLYSSWFDMHEDTNKIRNFKAGISPSNGETGKIVAIHPHGNGDWCKYPLCAILLDNDDSVVLVSEDGLRLNRAILFSDLIIQ